MSFISGAMSAGLLTGGQEIIRMCESALEKKYGFANVMLTNSCTMALEMAAVLSDIQPGDEVIVPAYTYVSTANAFALRGARIVFADSKTGHPDMDEEQLEALITRNTKAICVVHYAGIACNMDVIKSIARKHNLLVIEDAAQCIGSYYNGEALGNIGDIACFSFHETKNIHCGEGGFMVVNNPALLERAQVVRNKGTNRYDFQKGKVNKYEWVDIGFSSYPSAICAAFLHAQIEQIDNVRQKRLELWERYYRNLDTTDKRFELPVFPDYAYNNAHIFYIVCKDEQERNALIAFLKEKEIHAVFHYQALHKSPYYSKNNSSLELPNAVRYSHCLVRFPLFYELTLAEVDTICKEVQSFFLTT